MNISRNLRLVYLRLNFGVVPRSSSGPRPLSILSNSSFLYFISTHSTTILSAVERDARRKNFHYTHELPVIVERDCTCLFITSVNKRQIANHNTDSIWNEGQQRGVSATQRRVIRSFACIRRAHPWHASYWLSETGTRLSHRRSAGLYLEHSYLSWSPRFYPRPLH
jgi:hypothetical protein